MLMRNKPRYSIKKYILICVLSMTMGVISGAIILHILGSFIGYGSQTVLVIVLLSFPVCLFHRCMVFIRG
jgi:hypothetical protein